MCMKSRDSQSKIPKDTILPKGSYLQTTILKIPTNYSCGTLRTSVESPRVDVYPSSHSFSASWACSIFAAWLYDFEWPTSIKYLINRREIYTYFFEKRYTYTWRSITIGANCKSTRARFIIFGKKGKTFSIPVDWVFWRDVCWTLNL